MEPQFGPTFTEILNPGQPSSLGASMTLWISETTSGTRSSGASDRRES